MRTLYHMPLCPFSRKVRLLLAEKGLDFELEVENSWEQREDFLAINPSGEVPVLAEDELIICGSYAISEYLEEQYPELTFLGESLPERAETRRMISWYDEKFHREVTAPLLYERVYRQLQHEGATDSTVLRQAKQALPLHLEYMNFLLQRQAWLGGEHMTLADLSAAAHLSCLDYLGDLSWEQDSLVKQWYATIKSHPAFQPLLKDRVIGFKPSAHYENLDF